MVWLIISFLGKVPISQILGGGQLAHMHVSACWAVAHVSYMKVAYTGVRCSFFRRCDPRQSSFEFVDHAGSSDGRVRRNRGHRWNSRNLRSNRRRRGRSERRLADSEMEPRDRGDHDEGSRPARAALAPRAYVSLDRLRTRRNRRLLALRSRLTLRAARWLPPRLLGDLRKPRPRRRNEILGQRALLSLVPAPIAASLLARILARRRQELRLRLKANEVASRAAFALRQRSNKGPRRRKIATYRRLEFVMELHVEKPLLPRFIRLLPFLLRRRFDRLRLSLLTRGRYDGLRVAESRWRRNVHGCANIDVDGRRVKRE